MDDEGSRADVALIGAAITVGMIVVVSMTDKPSGGAESHEDRRAESAELAGPAELEAEPGLSDELGEPVLPFAAGKDPFGPHETASNCVGFCFNAVIDSVDEENPRLARVVVIGKKGERTPALVERTSVLSSSVLPAAERQPVRFACFDRVLEEDGLRFESCSQMAVGE